MKLLQIILYAFVAVHKKDINCYIESLHFKITNKCSVWKMTTLLTEMANL